MRNHPRGLVGTVCLSSPTLTSNLRVRAERPAHRAFFGYSVLTVVLDSCFDKASALSTVHELVHRLNASACSATEGGNPNLIYHRSRFGRVGNCICLPPPCGEASEPRLSRRGTGGGNALEIKF